MQSYTHIKAVYLLAYIVLTVLNMGLLRRDMVTVTTIIFNLLTQNAKIDFLLNIGIFYIWGNIKERYNFYC